MNEQSSRVGKKGANEVQHSAFLELSPLGGGVTWRLDDHPSRLNDALAGVPRSLLGGWGGVGGLITAG